MAENDLIRQGMPKEEARRRARVELGGLTQLREATLEAGENGRHELASRKT